jgi:hypothetical protein
VTEPADEAKERAARFGYGEDWDGTGLRINGEPYVPTAEGAPADAQ